MIRLILSFLSRFANSEQMIRKLSESYPIRRSAQMMAYFYLKSNNLIKFNQPRFLDNKSRLINFKNRFLEEFRNEMKRTKDKMNKS
ncbi:Stearoyl-CoA desaturase 5 [Sarcoptes scabiei]|nr:Stearoyl-CoA desaturase 5 [Sarcoptes scabiei]